MLAISVGHKAGTYKDTARNILETEEFVVHIADQPLIEKVHASAAEFPADVSEIETLGLRTVPCRHVAPPRIESAPVAMECRLRHCMEFGETRSRLMVGEVVTIHIRDGLVSNGKIDTRALNPIARIAGPTYATLGEIITLAPIAQTPKS
jgi:flavin reductase (DIM6/NTAB) family NADH-FMN oxidoreductase RutF